jgi:hypothetical protein
MRDGGKCIGTATHSSVPVVLKVSPISLRCSSRRPLNVARSSFYLTVALERAADWMRNNELGCRR